MKSDRTLQALMATLIFTLVGCSAITPAGTIPGTIPPATAGQAAPASSPLALPEGGTEEDAEGGEVIRGDALIDSVEILLPDSSAAQAEVTIRGNLPDGCTTLEPAAVARENNTFTIALTTRRKAAEMCTQALVPFEQTVLLDLAGLPAGEYVVEVNGVRDTFTLG